MTARATVDIRLRSRISDEEMDEKVGKILTEEDYNLVPTRDCIIRKPDGQVLAVYRRGLIPEKLRESSWPILHEFQSAYTNNRARASGTPKVLRKKQSVAYPVSSSIIGAFDNTPRKMYCRLTAWTGRETEKFRILWPLLEFIGECMKVDAPDRWESQMFEVQRTHPDWVIPGTPFTTVTVNNTYPTGVHKDAGDLDSGFSTLAVLRRGDYRGAVLVFPLYRVGIDMQDGDLLLMDAHEYHGNTEFDPPVERNEDGRPLVTPEFERISVVSYFRTKMVGCGSAGDENEKAQILAEQRAAAAVGE